jgi:hypothetical protein
MVWIRNTGFNMAIFKDKVLNPDLTRCATLLTQTYTFFLIRSKLVITISRKTKAKPLGFLPAACPRVTWNRPILQLTAVPLLYENYYAFPKSVLRSRSIFVRLRLQLVKNFGSDSLYILEKNSKFWWFQKNVKLLKNHKWSCIVL